MFGSGELWASDVLRMNDPNEITYAFNKVLGPIAQTRENGYPKYRIKSVKEEIVKDVWGRWCTHVTCFSSSSEISSQWERYAKNSGFAVGFDRVRLGEWCKQKGISLLPIIYNRAHQEEMIRRLLQAEVDILTSRQPSDPVRSVLRDKTDLFLASIMMTLKEPSWSEEEEWRILVVDAEGRFERFTRNDGVCYFKLSAVKPELITELVLGPECPENCSDIKRRLDEFGFDSVRIRQTSATAQKG
jgi:hypothetical protein